MLNNFLFSFLHLNLYNIYWFILNFYWYQNLNQYYKLILNFPINKLFRNKKPRKFKFLLCNTLLFFLNNSLLKNSLFKSAWYGISWNDSVFIPLKLSFCFRIFYQKKYKLEWFCIHTLKTFIFLEFFIKRDLWITLVLS